MITFINLAYVDLDVYGILYTIMNIQELSVYVSTNASSYDGFSK